MSDSHTIFHFACRNRAIGESGIFSYQTVSSEPSESSTVEGYPRSLEGPSSEIVIGSDQVFPWSSLIRAWLPYGLRR